MARRAGTRTAAFRDNAGHRVLDRGFHDGLPWFRVYDVGLPAVFDVCDFDHGHVQLRSLCHKAKTRALQQPSSAFFEGLRAGWEYASRLGGERRNVFLFLFTNPAFSNFHIANQWLCIKDEMGFCNTLACGLGANLSQGLGNLFLALKILYPPYLGELVLHMPFNA
jgi:hypothetical protein